MTPCEIQSTGATMDFREIRDSVKKRRNNNVCFSICEVCAVKGTHGIVLYYGVAQPELRCNNQG